MLVKNFKVISLVLFQASWIFSTQSARAHAPDERPMDIISSSQYGRSFGGYGYLASQARGSEAGANWAFNFECGNTKQREYIGQACTSTISPSQEAEDFISDAMRVRVIQSLQERAMEYYAYQLNATSTAQPPNITRPSCIPEDSPVWQQLSTGVLAAPPNWSGASGRQAQDKRNAALQGLDTKNMAKALMYTEYVKKQMKDRYHCDRQANASNSNCQSLRNNLVRLHNSFPALWTRSRRSDISGHEDREDMGLYDSTSSHVSFDSNDHMVYTNYYDQFKNDLIGLIGAENETIATSGRTGDQIYQDARREGQDYWNDGTQNMDSSTITSIKNYTDFEEEMEVAYDSARNATAGTARSMMFERITNTTNQIKAEHETRMRTALRNICDSYNPARASSVNPYSHMSGPGRAQSVRRERLRGIAGMLLSHPNMIRQALLDMGEPDRLFTQAVLCETGLMPKVRDEIQCEGVSGGPLPGTPVNVARRSRMYNWPFSSNNYCSISRPEATGPMNLNLTVSLVVGPGLAGSNCSGAANADANHNNIPDCVESRVNLWQADAEGFLNCSTGQVPNFQALQTSGSTQQVNCPIPANSPNARRDPPVRFNINFNIVTDAAHAPPPVVTMHECFSANVEDVAQRGNCDAVRTDWLARCTEPAASCTCPASDTNCTRCMNCSDRYTHFRANTPWAVDRANSGNYPLTQRSGTLRHEVMHLLGAPDEYDETDVRPYDLLADNNSIMSCSNCSSAQMQPRHLDQMLLPLRCMESRGGP